MMQISSKNLYASLWPVEVLGKLRLPEHDVEPENETDTLLKRINGIYHKTGFSPELIREVHQALERLETEAETAVVRPLFYLLFFGYLDEDRLSEAEQLRKQFGSWLSEHEKDRLYVQMCTEFYQQNWLTAYYFAEEFHARYGQQPPDLEAVRRYEEIYPCDAWIKGYLAAVFLRKPRKAIDFLETFADDPAFHQETAIRILKAIQDLSYLFVSLYLRKIWQRFPEEHFILQIFKLVPVDQLHQHEKEFLAELLLPRIQNRPTLEGGKILMHLERYEEASQVLSSVEGKPPVLPEAKFLAAQAFLEIGEFEKAKGMLEALQQIDPTHTEANILMEILNPMVGEVQKMTPDLQNEEEELLASAIYTCIRYLESDQEELALFLFKNILFAMEPALTDQPFNMDQLKKYIELMERRASKAEFQKLLGQLRTLKSLLQKKQMIDVHSI